MLLSVPTFQRARRSRPVLDRWPQLLQGNLRPAAVVDCEVLVGHSVGVADLARGFDGVEEAFKFLSADAQYDDDLPGIVPAYPERIALVRADGMGKAVLRSE